MFKVTYKATESVNFFKWFKCAKQAKTFASALDDRYIKLEKL